MTEENEPATAVIERLYREASRQFLLAAFALTADAAEAEDVVQEAFVRAFARPGQIARADNPVAWMHTVTVNIARSRLRRKRRLRLLLPALAEPAPNLPGLDAERVVLMNALRQLPLQQREAIALFYLADMSLQQVADTLGRTPAAVKARLHRGRKSLAELLGADGPSTVLDLQTRRAQ